MGFDEGEILLDSPTAAYYSGQFVNGRLVFELTKVKKVRGIYIKVKGFCKVHWRTEHSRRVNDRTESYTVDHDSYEEYISLKIYLIGSKNNELELNPGKYDYPFGFQLPDSCPSSFEGSKGHVRYEIKAVVDRPFAIDQEKIKAFRVYAPLDLNRADCNEPVNFEFYQSYCCWCISSGSSETLVKLPTRGYCPGQVIPVEVACKNTSSVEIDEIVFKIKKEIIYRAESNPATEEENETLLEVKKGPIPPNSDRSWTVEMTVPDTDAPNMNTCSFIDINYEFKVTVEPGGCHSSDDDTCKLVFGSIPLVGFQDDYKHPLHDQMPQSNVIPPTMVPQNQYPVPQPQYPNAVTNQPMPASPYPNTNPPYPAPNPQPYPGPNPPYPNGAYSANPPYPSTLGLQPTNGNQPPYPTPQSGGSPYPGATTAPYPVTTTPLKTGNFGFAVTGEDPASIPLLPTGAVPYPINPASDGLPERPPSASKLALQTRPPEQAIEESPIRPYHIPDANTFQSRSEHTKSVKSCPYPVTDPVKPQQAVSTCPYPISDSPAVYPDKPAPVKLPERSSYQEYSVPTSCSRTCPYPLSEDDNFTQSSSIDMPQISPYPNTSNCVSTSSVSIGFPQRTLNARPQSAPIGLVPSDPIGFPRPRPYPEFDPKTTTQSDPSNLPAECRPAPVGLPQICPYPVFDDSNHPMDKPDRTKSLVIRMNPLSKFSRYPVSFDDSSSHKPALTKFATGRSYSVDVCENFHPEKQGVPKPCPYPVDDLKFPTPTVVNQPSSISQRLLPSISDPPYPVSAKHPVPYSPQSNPTPERIGVTGRLLRTGNVGFIVTANSYRTVSIQSDDRTPRAPSPYAAASAPQPATPDNDLKTPDIPNPPYNPDFKEESKN